MMTYTMNTALDDFLKSEHPWMPPEYPSLGDVAWSTRFESASQTQRENLANLWHWWFNLQTMALTTEKKVEVIGWHHKFIRTIHPFVTSQQMRDESPFSVFVHFMHKEVNSSEHKESFLEHMKTLWFGTNEARLDVMGPLFDDIHETHFQTGVYRGLPECVYNLILELTWDAVNAAPTIEDTHLANAVAITSRIGLSNVFPNDKDPDERRVAWHTLGYAVFQSYSDFAQVKKDIGVLNVMGTIRSMPSAVVYDGINRLIDYSSTKTKNGKRTISRRSLLGPPSNNKKLPNEYDIMRHWMPEHAGYWDTAEALGIPVQEAGEKAFGKDKPGVNHAVTIPHDMAENLTLDLDNGY